VSETKRTARAPSLTDARVPTLTLIALLSMSVYLFGEDSSYRANQIALIITAFVAIATV
jgi:NhaC family Na+:H+ antiporter